MGNPTEELRAKLDELGVEYTANDEKHVKETCWPYMGELMAAFAEYDNGTTRFACDTWCFTPEQAIAATVGAGTLTAEQVRECAKEVYFEGYGDGATHKVNGIEETDWQTIADKLNATLGAGTCKRIYHPNRITKTCTCSNCGYGASDERWAYCPKCGHKYVHGEVEERWKRAGRKVAE